MLKTKPDIQEKFDRFRDQWHAETAHLSSVEARCMHPAYQKIIGMGTHAVPLLLRELQSRPDHWFWALSAITCEDPIPAELHGNVSAMADVWIEWGRQQGYI